MYTRITQSLYGYFFRIGVTRIFSSVHTEHMVLVGCAIAPHGALVLDKEKEVPETAKKLHDAMQTLAMQIRKWDPDTIFLISPHGISLEHDLGIILNETVHGTAEWEQEYKEFIVEYQVDKELATHVIKELSEKGLPIQGIITYTQSLAAPLRWGETIPLWFIKDLEVQVIIGSLPFSRYTRLQAIANQLADIGTRLYEVLERSQKKIAFIISGDLAHTHQDTEVYKFSPAAEQFDSLIEQWVKNRTEVDLIKEAIPLSEKALVCGIGGFIILDQILEKTRFQSHFLYRAHPTYYGMLVAYYD